MPLDDDALPVDEEAVTSTPPPPWLAVAGTEGADPPPPPDGIVTGVVDDVEVAVDVAEDMVDVAVEDESGEGNKNAQLNRNFAFLNILSPGSVPEKLPQNICSVLVVKTAEFWSLNEDVGASNGKSGFPSAFSTFPQLPMQSDG